jgi:energy-coupling factor transport system ATP-binding protein
MAMRPEVLVLDEPAAGLDPQGRDYILNGIYEYQRKTDCTVLIVSHSMEDMARFCDDVVVMSNAHVIMHGSCNEVFSKVEKLSGIGLDIPQITHLMNLLSQAGINVPQNVYTVEAALDAVRVLFQKKGGASK